MFVCIAALTTELSLRRTPSFTVGTDSVAVVASTAKLTVFAPSSADATMSSDSDTDTLTLSGLFDDSTGFDAVRVERRSRRPRSTPPSPPMVTAGRADGGRDIGQRPGADRVIGLHLEGVIAAIGHTVYDEATCSRLQLW